MVLGNSESSVNDSFPSLSNTDAAANTQVPDISLPLRRRRYIPRHDDPDFQQGSWAKLSGDVGLPLGPFLDSNVAFSRISKILSMCPKLQRIPAMILFVKSFRLSDDGAFAVVKDPSGEMDASFHHSVIDEFKSDLIQGSSLVIRNVCLLTVSPKRQVLNIVLRNVICVQPPPSVHMPTQMMPNVVSSSDEFPPTSSSFQKLRDLQAPPSIPQASTTQSFNLSPDRSVTTDPPVHAFRKHHTPESANSNGHAERMAISQVRFSPEHSDIPVHSATASASSSSSSSQAFVMQRVVPGLSQYLAAKRARETASTHQSASFAADSSGAGLNAASNSGRSVGSDTSSASSTCVPVQSRQSPLGVRPRTSRLCDPDDESALDVD